MIEMNFCFIYSLLKGVYPPSFHVRLIDSELWEKLVFKKTAHNSLVHGFIGWVACLNRVYKFYENSIDYNTHPPPKSTEKL